MATEITSKSELAALATKLDSKSKEIVESMNNISTTLKSVSNYDGIDVTSAANLLSNNLTNISTDLTTASLNISSYAGLIEEFDSDDFEIGDTSSTNDATVTLSNPTTDNSSNSSSEQNTNSSAIVSGVTAGVVTNSQSNTSSNSAGKHYSSNNSNYSGSSNSNNSSSGGISSSGPVKITQGDPNNPDIDITKYSNYPEKGFEVTTGNLCYELSDEDFELLCAIVSAESDKTYDDALAVITTILNRCETDNWIRSHGTDPIAQATAPNQFVVYQHGSYRVYMDGRAPETVVQAVKDALAGVRNHKYLSFRSNGTTSYSDNMISRTGNRYK